MMFRGRERATMMFITIRARDESSKARLANFRREFQETRLEHREDKKHSQIMANSKTSAPSSGECPESKISRAQLRRMSWREKRENVSLFSKADDET